MIEKLQGRCVRPQGVEAEFGLNRRVAPTPALCDVVESIWLQQSCARAPRVPSSVIPTGTIELLFHYGDRLAHVEGDRLEWMPRSYVTGQRTRPVFTMPGKWNGIVIVSLYPWGLRSLFPECVDEPDGYVDLKLVMNSSLVVELEERLVAARETSERVRLVEDFLLARRLPGPGDLRMIAAVRRLASATAPPGIAELAERWCMSRRHFARLFRSTVGVPPKTFSRIMRFQQAIRLRRDRNLPWAVIAVECGYADQAHLSHELKHFSARTAGEIGFDRGAGDEIFNGGASRFFDTVYL